MYKTITSDLETGRTWTEGLFQAVPLKCQLSARRNGWQGLLCCEDSEALSGHSRQMPCLVGSATA